MRLLPFRFLLLDWVSYSIFGEFYRPELIFEFGILLYFAFIISIFQRRIIYRPIGSEPDFTTAKEFPERLCLAVKPEIDPDCQAAARDHRIMMEDYKALMRQGAQPSVTAVASLRAQRPSSDCRS